MYHFDLFLTNATCLLPSGTKKAHVGIKLGKIEHILDEIPQAFDAKEVIDLEGKYILPGVIDSQVHFREPGLTHKEDLATGSASAALGGVTTFLEMPNTNPATTTVQAIQEKVAIAKEKSLVNFGFFMGATGENLEELQKVPTIEGCCGIKIFLGSSTGDLLLFDEKKLLETFQGTKSTIAVHSENEILLRERKDIQQNAKSVHAHSEWRNEEVCFTSTERIINIAKKSNHKVHVLHITSKKEIEFLRENKKYCTVEVTPQHLTLFAPDCYDRLDTLAQMNPPIREDIHRQALWEGIKNGTVDVIGSDHAPHTLEEKKKGYPHSPSGMPGVQTLLPLMLNFVNEGKLTLEKLVELVCTNPAKLYGLSTKGQLRVGSDADITVIDMNKTHTFTNEEMATKSSWTPFAGMKVKGMPIKTIVHGKIVMDNGKLIGKGGKPIHSH